MKVAISPAGVPTPNLHYSTAIKAGPWLFTSGLTAADFKTGIAQEARADRANPYHASPQKKQSAYIFKNLMAILKAAGTSETNLLYTSMYYTPLGLDLKGTTHFSYEDYLTAGARKYFTEGRNCQTGHVIKGFPVAETAIELDWIASVPTKNKRRVIPYAQLKSAGYENIPPLSLHEPMKADFKPIIEANGILWTSGQIAMQTREHPYSADPLHTKKGFYGTIWYGSEIKQQSRYALEGLKKCFNAAGGSWDDIVYAHVLLADIHDYAGLEEVWKEYFPRKPPARSITPAKLGMYDCVVEIDLFGLAKESDAKKEIVSTDEAPTLGHESQAVKAGDLLFLTDQLAANSDGEVDKDARVDEGMKYLESPIKKQTQVIFKNMKAICKAAGARLDDVVKINAMFTDMRDLAPSFELWKENFPKVPPVATIAEVESPLVAKGCLVSYSPVAYVGR